MSKLELTVNKYSTEGSLQDTYSSLKNLISKDKKEVRGFNTSEISYDWNNPLNIEFQRSYDDSTNLILNNGSQIPRLINSSFVKLGNNRYKFIKRDQGVATNMYEENKINTQTDLFLRSFTWPIFDLKSVQDGGQLAGGNYIFYLKYADEDDNLSDIVGESSVISIFNGTSPSTSYGTIMHETTPKLIELKIKNLDVNYSRFYLYFTRETCDTNGISFTKCYKITTSYKLKNELVVVINGFENTEELSIDELNIKYNYYSSAKTQTTIQNMLFLGNVSSTSSNSQKLQQLSYYINTSMQKKEQSIGYVNEYYAIDTRTSNAEYYDPKNIYYYLGYWPDEYYQIGVVYLLNDGTTTNAFMLRGGKFVEDSGNYTLESGNLDFNNFKNLEYNAVLNDVTYENTAGIFKTPNCQIFDHDFGGVHPLFFKFEISDGLRQSLEKEGVKGLFFVRSKRIPTSLFQGISCPVDKESGLLAPKVQINGDEVSIIESFIDQDNIIKDSPIKQNIEVTNSLNYSSLISLDPIISPQLKNLLTWSQYHLHPEYQCTITSVGGRSYNVMNYKNNEQLDDQISKLVYIDKDTPSMFIGDNYFSTRAGNAENVREFAFIETKNTTDDDIHNIARGVYCPMIGCDKKITDSTIYTVKIKHDDTLWFNSLINQNSVFFPISNRYNISDLPKTINIFRGDCFTNTVTIRLNRNFIDPTFPSNDLIVDEKTWKENYKGLINMVEGKDNDDKTKDDWSLINLSDVNNAPLGRWLTFKCLSNYNLGLRSFDMRDLSYLNQLGTKSSFYPITAKSIKSANKVPESELLNEGYSITLGRKYYTKWIPTPYENYNFENRIAFSNVAATKMFTNGFRIFQGLSYQDVDNRYGAIVKLLPYGQNLLCVFEHGLSIIPVNEKALLSTQEGLSIHLYGSGVLQEQVSVISPDYGSTWSDSIIRTPDAYYGVDTYAKKIWKFNNTEGFQCISDFKTQSFLNDNIKITSEDGYFWGATNVKTHYNNFKGDVMFTFYHNDKIWNLCYNEKLKVWTTRYSWVPLLSTNINNTYYSFNLKEANALSKLLEQTKKDWGIICKTPIYDYGIPIDYKNEFFKNYTLKLVSLTDIHNYINMEGISMYNSSNKLVGVLFNNGISEFKIDQPCLLTLHSNEIIIKDGDSWKLYYPEYAYDEETEEEIIYDDADIESLIEGDLNSWNICYSIDDEINIYGIGTIEENKLYFSKSLLNSNNFVKNKTKVTIGAYHNNLELEVYSFIIGNGDYTKITMPLYTHNIDSDITKWYDQQESFEFEFIVNQPSLYQKIFNNLVIISNNAEPSSLEIEIVGDAYDFKQNFINQNVNDIKYEFPTISLPKNKTYKTKLTFDKTLKEYRLCMTQDCLNIKKFGRRLGNISYIEGKWHIVLQPIHYKDQTLKTARLRDKWAKIRIKYSGEKLAIITAIQTLMNISY